MGLGVCYIQHPERVRCGLARLLEQEPRGQELGVGGMKLKTLTVKSDKKHHFSFPVLFHFSILERTLPFLDLLSFVGCLCMWVDGWLACVHIYRPI